MTTIAIDIDEVPVRIGKKGLELAQDGDPQRCGFVSFSVDVEVQDNGHWDITEVYPAIDWDIAEGSSKMVNVRGEKAIGQFAIDAAKFLGTFAEETINDEVHDTIMQAPRSQFQQARVV